MATETTLGIDLAAQPSRTAGCLIEWSNGLGSVTRLELGWDDDRILAELDACGRCGIDVPLGWPTAFVDAITAHRNRQPWQERQMEFLRLRATDRYLADQVGRAPLSVSTDKIGVPALRGAALLTQFDPSLDRSGAGKVIEVYPAAALRRWGFDPFEDHHGSRRLLYKGNEKKGGLMRRLLVTALRARTDTWLSASEEVWEACIDSDDLLDAVLSSLVARAAALGLVDPIPTGMAEEVVSEGWIALPVKDALTKIAEGTVIHS